MVNMSSASVPVVAALFSSGIFLGENTPVSTQCVRQTETRVQFHVVPLQNLTHMVFVCTLLLQMTIRQTNSITATIMER